MSCWFPMRSKRDRRRLGHIRKQGNVLLRFLVKEPRVTVRSLPERRTKDKFLR